MVSWIWLRYQENDLLGVLPHLPNNVGQASISPLFGQLICSTFMVNFQGIKLDYKKTTTENVTNLKSELKLMPSKPWWSWYSCVWRLNMSSAFCFVQFKLRSIKWKISEESNHGKQFKFQRMITKGTHQYTLVILY